MLGLEIFKIIHGERQAPKVILDFTFFLLINLFASHLLLLGVCQSSELDFVLNLKFAFLVFGHHQMQIHLLTFLLVFDQLIVILGLRILLFRIVSEWLTDHKRAMELVQDDVPGRHRDDRSFVERNRAQRDRDSKLQLPKV
jgi:hypothetical protein